MKSAFIHFFHDFIHLYRPKTGADIPLGTKFSCQRQHLVTLVISCKFQKISVKSDFIHFFHDFIHVYSPKAGADNPLWMKFLCQQEHLFTLVTCCKFQKNLFEI